jgi:type IV secretory pathway VirB2 component (pilin)
MNFDLRLPIGLLFAVFGVILAGDGLIAHRLVLDVNVNLWWGLVMIVFGAAMLGLAARAKSAPPVRPR